MFWDAIVYMIFWKRITGHGLKIISQFSEKFWGGEKKRERSGLEYIFHMGKMQMQINYSHMAQIIFYYC